MSPLSACLAWREAWVDCCEAAQGLRGDAWPFQVSQAELNPTIEPRELREETPRLLMFYVAFIVHLISKALAGWRG